MQPARARSVLSQFVPTVLFFALAFAAHSQGRFVLHGHVPAALANLRPVGALPAANHLHLVIGLPLRNQPELDSFLNQLNDLSSTNYHRWLTPGQFTARFAPTEGDYEKVLHFATANGFKVSGLSANRLLVDVDAPVGNIEKALHLTLRLYPHPTEKRNFFAPDKDPSVDTNVPILHISGLDNFTLPHPLGLLAVHPLATNSSVFPEYTGSAPGGYFMGNDFRAAYVPGVTNTGAGQYIAIADVGGLYYPNDVYMYETNAGISTNTTVTNIVTTFTSYWTNALTGSSTDDGEEALDICMAMSMAPDATIMNYEGDAHDVFNRIAQDDKAKQITLSYGFGIDVSIIQSFQEFLAQGQALSQASGDGDADLNGGTGLTGNPYATIVGGTTLTTSGAGGPWSSETAWNWNNNGGSGGGISGYGIPAWQQGVATTANQGSADYRNYPDVAMPADGVFLISKNGTSVGWVGGTSCASPLWAGFMALVNQQAANLGKPSVGFPNPAIYALGKGPYAAYANCFHDITTGNNYNSQNPTRFPATVGYDLCTGWGTPCGSNTIAALAGAGTNNFAFYDSQGVLNVVPGGVATTTFTLEQMNGFNSAVSFTISGLPAGVNASFSPVTTSSSTLLTLTAAGTASPGTNTLTVVGTSGGLGYSIPINLIISPLVPGTSQVNLSASYNRSGIWSDGVGFSGGLDNGGYAYSANLLGIAPSWNGIAYHLGPANAPDAVSCAGQTISLPAGNYTSLQILGTGVDGSQTSKDLIVTYTDNSTATLSQSFSDWAYPQNYPGESRVATMAYRDWGGGSSDLYTSVNLYDYDLALDQTRTIKSLTLPNNGNVVILAIALADEPVAVPLASFYNRAGIYDDGTTFTNPPTGGIDGSGYAYSANLLTGSRIWTNTLFNFGPANVTNVVSAAGQIIPLPAGKYAALRMLATGVQGSQPGQVFYVRYTDSTVGTYDQGLSDWFSPQNYAGEFKAILMGHRTVSDGSKDSRTFYLYGYSFSLNSGKVVQSIQLPADAHVIVTAISLVPNWPPQFSASPFAEPAVTAGQYYSATIATNASDLNGDLLTFGQVSGPTWLTVSGSGALSGLPLSSNAGLNSFVVSVTDPGGLSNTATMNINVQPAPAIVSGLNAMATNILLNWSGGISPYQVQMSTNLGGTNWVNVGSPISSNTVMIVPTNPASFYRIMGR